MTPEEEAMSKDREIAASEARLRMIIDMSPDAVMVLSSAGIILFANPAAERLFERPAAEMIGTEFGFLVLGARDNRNRDDLKKWVLQTAEMRLADIEWEGEKAILLTLRDITHAKHSENELRERIKEFACINNISRPRINPGYPLMNSCVKRLACCLPAGSIRRFVLPHNAEFDRI